MKLYPEQLGPHLKGPLAPVYVLSGDEPLQLLEASDALRAAARSAGYLNRELFTVDGGFDWSAFRAACDTQSLFGEARVLDVRFTAKPDKTATQALMRFAERPPADVLLLLALPKLGKAELAAGWCSALERIGVVIQVWPLEGEKLIRWLDRRLNARGLLCDQSGLHLLAARVEGNLLAAAQEIEKLAILHGSGRLTDEQIVRAVADSARYDVFDLAQEALLGQVGKAARILSGLRGEGIAAPVVLWALTRECRLLNQLQTERQQGVPTETLFARHRIWEPRKSAFGHALQRNTPATIRRALMLAAQADRIIKGLQSGDDWDTLLMICESLSGPRAPTAPFHQPLLSQVLN